MALSQYEQEMFEGVLTADGFHLLEADLDGQRVGVLAVEIEDETEGEDAEHMPVLPVAILLTEAMAERLSPPVAAAVSDTDVPGVSSSDPPD